MTVNGRIQMVPFLRLAIVLVLGIVVGDAIAVTHWLWGGIAALSLLCALLLRHKPVVQGAFFMVTVATLGAWWTAVYELRQQALLSSKPNLSGGGNVDACEKRKGSTVRLIFA